MQNEYLSLVDHEFLYDFDNGKNYLALREIIRATGSNYHHEVGQSEFDYYLHNLQKVDPLKAFQDDWSVGLLSEAMFVLIRNNTKCEAILHYIVDHNNVKIHDDHIVEACKSYETIAFKLIKRGADIHHVKFYNRYSTLHTAALAGFTNLVEYLLTCKVDPNALTVDSDNALHCACINGNLDIVRLIIQTDVDLDLCQKPLKRTPIGLAILTENFDAASLILKSPIADDLKFDLAYDLFCNLCNHKLKNVDSMDLTLFELIWEKLVKTYCVATRDRSILSIYLANAVFRAEKWSSGLKVILTSTVASTVLEEYADLNGGKDIFASVISKFDRVGVEKENRMEIVEVLLSLGVKPTVQDLATTLFYFQCQEEFDLLSCHLADGCDVENQMQYVASVFCGLCHHLNVKRLKNLDKDVFNFVTQYFNEDAQKITSLKELSRRTIRKLVIENTEVLLPRHFVTAVNSLKIPVRAKQFLMLKIPLNKF